VLSLWADATTCQASDPNLGASVGPVRATIAGTEDEQKKEGVEVTAQEPKGHEPYLQPPENEQNSW